jgi:hypothetical protein
MVDDELAGLLESVDQELVTDEIFHQPLLDFLCLFARGGTD